MPAPYNLWRSQGVPLRRCSGQVSLDAARDQCFDETQDKGFPAVPPGGMSWASPSTWLRTGEPLLSRECGMS